ncbi:hypothetical protein AB6A40_008189 [Gnathostoma spinigerum]|uniref:Uncharacterized protein n=1 Tax=Gnathostoma spinigerum TaxID=75299 RepID=A0ABD6EYY5_9BILA
MTEISDEGSSRRVRQSRWDTASTSETKRQSRWNAHSAEGDTDMRRKDIDMRKVTQAKPFGNSSLPQKANLGFPSAFPHKPSFPPSQNISSRNNCTKYYDQSKGRLPVNSRPVVPPPVPVQNVFSTRSKLPLLRPPTLNPHSKSFQGRSQTSDTQRRSVQYHPG